MKCSKRLRGKFCKISCMGSPPLCFVWSERVPCRHCSSWKPSSLRSRQNQIHASWRLLVGETNNKDNLGSNTGRKVQHSGDNTNTRKKSRKGVKSRQQCLVLFVHGPFGESCTSELVGVVEQQEQNLPGALPDAFQLEIWLVRLTCGEGDGEWGISHSARTSRYARYS
ncbi:hypothetical protein RRG08_025336 [Elysia crispata]|uniref:Uncharacterized protein n=1 Tax=Elysia crispata TaxID=231223 RepID=A0AAE1A9B1_9GAST|nr:hypothetical protein RRG08_025336 [Elysia crispata]